MTRSSALALLFWAMLLGGLRLFAEEAEAPVEADETAEESEEEVDALEGEPAGPLDPAADLLKRLWEDPTLGGKIHFYYTGVYRGRFHDFGSYDYPFPEAVSADDISYAQELARRHDDWDDHDIDHYIALSWDELLAPADETWWQKVDAEVSLRAFRDLDGSPHDEETLDGFDALSGNSQLRLQALSATVETFERHLEWRLGRQLLEEAEWIHFDGGRLRFRGATFLGREVELSAFGGARVRFWRRASSEHVGIGGAALKMWPWEGGRLRLSDVYFLDNSFEVELRQHFELGYAALTYRQIDEDPQSVWFDLHLDWSEHAVKVDLDYRGKLGRDADDFDFDYTRSRRRDPSGTKYLYIGDLAPYDDVTVEVRKGLFEHWGVFAGGTLHYLRERDLRDEYSTDWQEAWLGVDVSHAPWRGFTGRAAVRYLNTDLRRRLLRFDAQTVITNGAPDFQEVDITGDGEPDFLGLDLLFEQDFSRTVAVGTAVLFRGYDYQSNYAFIENLTATSATVYTRWMPTPRASWHLSYSYDRDFEVIYPDLDALHTVRLQFTYRL